MRQQWKTAREKDRRKARYLVRQRVLADPTTDLVEKENEGDGLPLALKTRQLEGENEASMTNCASMTEEESAKLQHILDAIAKGDRSCFSVSLLAEEVDLLSGIISTEILLEHMNEERMLSCYGEDYLRLVKKYLQSFTALPLMEYSVLQGRYYVLSAMLLGGVSPCSRAIKKRQNGHGESIPNQKTCEIQRMNAEQDLRKISKQLMRRFFHSFPLLLSSYIVKRVVDMRLQSFVLESSMSEPNHQQFTCAVCQQTLPIHFRLIFSDGPMGKSSPSCCHAFCELCFWNDILQHIDSRLEDDDVVQCPCCHHSAGDKTKSKELCPAASLNRRDTAIHSPRERCQDSRQKFESLPTDPKTLKKSKYKRKKVPESLAICSSWKNAVVPSLGLCQSVRQEKLFSYMEKGALPYVKGCLDEGADVNVVNEYGHTPLYLATWGGNQALVELLLSYGANPWTEANGGLTLDGLCRSRGDVHILEAIERVRKEHWGDTENERNKEDVPPINSIAGADQSNVQTLIDPSKDHPGAGSYLITDCLSVTEVQSLVQLWGSLPIDQSSEKTAKKKGKCADRAYFCDAEGWLRSLLKQRIVEAFRCHFDPVFEESHALVLPHVRFLHYSQAGSALAPHIDLCRVDQETGERSSHSFLLYLSSCECGGETILLGDLTGEGRHDMLARVKPQLGSLLLFPHACPHEGDVVEDVPKLLIRGEVVLQGLYSGNKN